jgi:hypothetical protein
MGLLAVPLSYQRNKVAENMVYTLDFFEVMMVDIDSKVVPYSSHSFVVEVAACNKIAVDRVDMMVP